jgi:hypothetical protein
LCAVVGFVNREFCTAARKLRLDFTRDVQTVTCQI